MGIPLKEHDFFIIADMSYKASVILSHLSWE